MTTRRKTWLATGAALFFAGTASMTVIAAPPGGTPSGQAPVATPPPTGPTPTPTPGPTYPPRPTGAATTANPHDPGRAEAGTGVVPGTPATAPATGTAATLTPKDTKVATRILSELHK